MSDPKFSMARLETLGDDTLLSLAETIAYVAGYLDIDIDRARDEVMKAIASGELKSIVMQPSAGNH